MELTGKQEEETPLTTLVLSFFFLFNFYLKDHTSGLFEKKYCSIIAEEEACSSKHWISTY